jgi:hypothetical protein
MSSESRGTEEEPTRRGACFVLRISATVESLLTLAAVEEAGKEKVDEVLGKEAVGPNLRRGLAALEVGRGMAAAADVVSSMVEQQGPTSPPSGDRDPAPSRAHLTLHCSASVEGTKVATARGWRRSHATVGLLRGGAKVRAILVDDDRAGWSDGEEGREEADK